MLALHRKNPRPGPPEKATPKKKRKKKKKEPQSRPLHPSTPTHRRHPWLSQHQQTLHGLKRGQLLPEPRGAIKATHVPFLATGAVQQTAGAGVGGGAGGGGEAGADGGGEVGAEDGGFAEPAGEVGFEGELVVVAVVGGFAGGFVDAGRGVNGLVGWWWWWNEE
jgi:hypothetical protein